MSVSRRYQYSLLSAHGMGMDTGFTEVETIGKKNKKDRLPGRRGRLQPCRRELYFGEDADLYHVPEFEDTMREVEEGRADYAVLPIENSTAGFVINNYDLLLKYKNYIVGEVYVPVAHMLLGVPGAKLSDIRTVYSHAQALAQSSDFLSVHKTETDRCLKHGCGCKEGHGGEGSVPGGCRKPYSGRTLWNGSPRGGDQQCKGKYDEISDPWKRADVRKDRRKNQRGL